jgi:hypothetical protein
LARRLKKASFRIVCQPTDASLDDSFLRTVRPDMSASRGEPLNHTIASLRTDLQFVGKAASESLLTGSSSDHLYRAMGNTPNSGRWEVRPRQGVAPACRRVCVPLPATQPRLWSHSALALRFRRVAGLGFRPWQHFAQLPEPRLEAPPAVKPISRSQWNAGFGTDSGPSRGDLVGALPAQLRRSRPRTATGALRRLLPSIASACAPACRA